MREMEEIQPIFSLSVGGGLSNSDDFCQLLADYLDRPNHALCQDGGDDPIGAWASAVSALGRLRKLSSGIRRCPFQ